MKILYQLVFILFFITKICWAGAADDFKAAEALWHDCNYIDSVKLYEKAISSGELSNEKMVEAHYNLAIVFFFYRQSDAIKEVNKLLKLNPEHLGAYSLRADAWAILGREDRALANWAKILDLDPEDTIAYSSRSMFYAERGFLYEAVKDLEKYLQLKPDSPAKKRTLGKLKAKLSKKRLNKK